MKRFLALMLAGIMLLCLSACGKDVNTPTDALNVVSGGSEQESANLKDILVEKLTAACAWYSRLFVEARA